MSPFYILISDELRIPLDKDLLTRMQQANQEEPEKLDERIKDAEQNLGSTKAYSQKRNIWPRLARR